MFVVTTFGESGSIHSVEAEQKGEMLDRVRYAMESAYIEEVRVSKVRPEPEPEPVDEGCTHHCVPNYTNLLPEALHYIDCTVWEYNA